ncbi:hypothetical protein B4Q13_24365 [Lacticaseibacillus rhamnosus]
MLLIHGARSALRAGKASEVPDDLRTWALEIERRSGHNVAAVALANKLARGCGRRRCGEWRQRAIRGRHHRRSERPGGLLDAGLTQAERATGDAVAAGKGLQPGRSTRLRRAADQRLRPVLLRARGLRRIRRGQGDAPDL